MELDMENIGDNMVVTKVDDCFASEHELDQSKSKHSDAAEFKQPNFQQNFVLLSESPKMCDEIETNVNLGGHHAPGECDISNDSNVQEYHSVDQTSVKKEMTEIDSAPGKSHRQLPSVREVVTHFI